MIKEINDEKTDIDYIVCSDADKMQVGYEIYNKIVGNNNRISVIRSLNQMLKMNGIDTEVIMKPLTFGNSSSTSMSPTKVDEKTVDNNNVEEKQDSQLIQYAVLLKSLLR